MKSKKHFLVAAAALGLGVGAGSLPAGDMSPPTAQVGLFAPAVSSLAMFSGYSHPYEEVDSAGCGPTMLDVRCTGVPSFWEPMFGWLFGAPFS